MGGPEEPVVDRQANGKSIARQDVPPRWWPRSVGTRLALAYAVPLVIVLAVAFAVGASLVRTEWHRAEEEQIQDIAVPLTVEAGFLSRRFVPSVELRNQLLADVIGSQAQELDVRVLAVDSAGTVRIDTNTDATSLIGTTLDTWSTEFQSVKRQATQTNTVARQVVTWSAANPDPFAGSIVVASADPGPGGVILLTIGEPQAPAAIGRLLRIFGWGLVVVLVITGIVTTVLNQRLTAPIAALAGASDDMAAGHLLQVVPGEGEDDIGRLVRQFNQMSARVAAVDAQQRTLLADVAHQLRTPLTTIRGYALGLANGVITQQEDRDRAIAGIDREADRMAVLIRDLLDLSRFESGQAGVVLAPTRIASMLHAVVDQFAAEAAAKSVGLSAEAADGLIGKLDQHRIEQALGNLVANAIRHTPAGGAVRLTASETAHTLVFRVIDSGEGMDEDLQARAFDRFARGSTSTSGGYGLGLAIVKEIVAAHAGSVTLESSHVAGTTVTMELPR